jgi:hypothetical protein
MKDSRCTAKLARPIPEDDWNPRPTKLNMSAPFLRRTSALRTVSLNHLDGQSLDGPWSTTACPLGHSLKRFCTFHADYTCSHCRKNFPRKTTMQGCRICDYDICRGCDAIRFEHRAQPKASRRFRDGAGSMDRLDNYDSAAPAVHPKITPKAVSKGGILMHGQPPSVEAEEEGPMRGCRQMKPPPRGTCNSSPPEISGPGLAFRGVKTSAQSEQPTGTSEAALSPCSGRADRDSLTLARAGLKSPLDEACARPTPGSAGAAQPASSGKPQVAALRRGSLSLDGSLDGLEFIDDEVGNAETLEEVEEMLAGEGWFVGADVSYPEAEMATEDDWIDDTELARGQFLFQRRAPTARTRRSHKRAGRAGQIEMEGMLSGTVPRPVGLKLLAKGHMGRGGYWVFHGLEDPDTGYMQFFLEGHFSVPVEALTRPLAPCAFPPSSFDYPCPGSGAMRPRRAVPENLRPVHAVQGRDREAGKRR